MAEHLLQGSSDFWRRFSGERDYLLHLAEKGQTPKALFIGCCDSRVVPEYLTGARVGDIFVLRNIANVVPDLEHPDASVGAAIDYAVNHLGVPDVSVCGHYGCGGVQAAMGDIAPLREAEPSLYEWLSNVTEPARLPLAYGLSGDAAARAAVELNVLSSLHHLTSYASVQRATESGALRLHGWVYDLHTSGVVAYDGRVGQFLPASEVMRQR